jgi:hypothetical protein
MNQIYTKHQSHDTHTQKKRKKNKQKRNDIQNDDYGGRSITSWIDLKETPPDNIPPPPNSTATPPLNNLLYYMIQQEEKREMFHPVARKTGVDLIKFQADRIKLDCFRIDLHHST